MVKAKVKYVDSRTPEERKKDSKVKSVTTSTDKRERDKKGRFIPGHSGGGRKKGIRNKETINREKALTAYQQEMLKVMMPIIRAQQQAAQGLVVVLRPGLAKNPKTKKLERTGELRQVKDPDEIEELFNSEGIGKDYHIVWAKDPNVKAIKDIWEMVFGKPPESLKVEHKGKVILLNK